MRLTNAIIPGLIQAAGAVNLYVSSYSGTVTSLQLSRTDGKYALSQTRQVAGCGVDPSWLTFEPSTRTLYCSDESINLRRSILTSYAASLDGSLAPIASAGTLYGPVSSVLYNNDSVIVQAHYLGSAVTTYTTDQGVLTPLQNFTFTQPAIGPVPSRQEAPHPHEVILDPTESFIVVPDLGSDLVRIFAIDKKTGLLTALNPFVAPPGSGPRHGAFLATENATYYYLVSELANTIAAYTVDYTAGGLTLSPVESYSLLGGSPIPAGAAAAEIVLAPGGNYVLTSLRGDNLFSLPNFDPANSTSIVSDSLQSWAIDHETGKLSFVQNAPAGGSFPRQFSVNADGSLAAVGLQNDGIVVIIERDVANGTFGAIVASIPISVGVSAVVWDEEDQEANGCY